MSYVRSKLIIDVILLGYVLCLEKAEKTERLPKFSQIKEEKKKNDFDFLCTFSFHLGPAKENYFSITNLVVIEPIEAISD